ncbi:Uncharacterized protein NEOC65_001605 [Neochlamydia sp. AcF65]|nr:Uncharacterized protein [Neochlamydia sp. AcF65]
MRDKKMKKFLTFLLVIMAAYSHLYSQSCDHARGRTQNALIPTFKLALAPRPTTDETAIAFFGEVGRRNYRANGTVGWLYSHEDRFKLSAEYLTQRLGYRFSTGKKERWMHQYALGAKYQHDFYHQFFNKVEATAYYSYAASHNLKPKRCEDFLYWRRIAGSSSYGGSLGITITPWYSGRFQVDADFDRVSYRRKYRSRKHLSGLGASFGYQQQIASHFFLDLLAEFKRPYNYGKVRLSWSQPEWTGLTVGLFGAHTQGKSHLPNLTTAGIELTYAFGTQKQMDASACTPCYCNPALAGWVSAPAVYMPEVLAIAEEKRKKMIAPPSCHELNHSPIPNFSFSGNEPYSFDISSYFSNPSGGALTFNASGLPTGASINPTTGLISGIGLQDNQVYNIVITATASDACASVSQSFTIDFPCVPPTSTPLENPVNLAVLSGDPYTLNQVTGHFFSPNGEPFTFTATGLPSDSSINPTTGVITGLSKGSGPTFKVTITGTTPCGSTSQSFVLTFYSA